MTRLDRLERALRAFVGRVELDCKTNSPGHRTIDDLLVLHEAGVEPFQARTGMDHVTYTILHGIVDMRDVLNEKVNHGKKNADHQGRRDGKTAPDQR